MQESALERNLKNRVIKAGGKCLKFVSPGVRGVPDRLCLFPGGRSVFVEMKKPGGKLHPLQEKCILDFEALGHAVYVIDSKDKIDSFIKEVVPYEIPSP